ncbi:MAG: DNA repair protein RecN [Anaerolineaceae bacterium]|nr:DNA repair protein RecN [Anaerolineaceae bacterium]
MLEELHIHDFAIIEDLNLQFNAGLVVFTGETGAGKSIILDALGAILGARVDTTSVRKGADRAIVEGFFRLEGQERELINSLLEREGLLEEPDGLWLGREIRAEGRTIARVNGRTVSLSVQSEIGEALVDVHGQTEHLSLLKVRTHRDLLDRFAHDQDVLGLYQAQFKEWAVLVKKLDELHAIEKTARDRADMLKYQIQEISEARIKVDEEESLAQERTRLVNAETLSTLSQSALALLDEGTEISSAATDLLGQAGRDLAELARIDPQMQALAQQIEDALSSVSDIAYELRGYLEEIEFNPNRLDQIEERLDLFNRLKRKYGGSLASALTHLEASVSELEKVEGVDEQIGEVKEKISQMKQLLCESGLVLSDQRKLAAVRLAEGVEQQLHLLEMEKARFLVSLSEQESDQGLDVNGRRFAFDASGLDQIEFLIETNPGEGFKPLAKTASGGETSRLMLALKSVLAEVDHIPTLVFDEIDSGIGGRVGMTVGDMLWNLGRQHQVLCVTHLPQLAAFGDQHFHVSKRSENERTSTQVEQLMGEARVEELAAMLGANTPVTMESAREILNTVAAKTSKI